MNRLLFFLPLSNCGFTPIIGFQLKSFFLEAAYDIGMNNIETNNEGEFKVYNRTFSLKIGYVFGGKLFLKRKKTPLYKQRHPSSTEMICNHFL